MRMKEDAMKNGQLKPAYNIQFAVDAEYIVWVTQGPQPSDMTTVIPLMRKFEQYFGKRYKNIIADSGYESEENYLELETKGYEAYIKPANYQQSKTRKYKQDIGRCENMAYDETGDTYTCANGKKLVKTGVRKTKSKTGYVAEKTVYSCEQCDNCTYKTSCIKGNNSKLPMEKRSKHLEISKLFQQKRGESEKRIKTEQGILLRMNRSIQSEGAFGEIKGNMLFRRFLCRGSANILAESILWAMAYNVNKLHHKIQSGRCGQYLHPITQVA